MSDALDEERKIGYFYLKALYEKERERADAAEADRDRLKALIVEYAEATRPRVGYDKERADRAVTALLDEVYQEK